VECNLYVFYIMLIITTGLVVLLYFLIYIKLNQNRCYVDRSVNVDAKCPVLKAPALRCQLAKRLIGRTNI